MSGESTRSRDVGVMFDGALNRLDNGLYDGQVLVAVDTMTLEFPAIDLDRRSNGTKPRHPGIDPVEIGDPQIQSGGVCRDPVGYLRL
jgi:hypothetical protein